MKDWQRNLSERAWGARQAADRELSRFVLPLGSVLGAERQIKPGEQLTLRGDALLPLQLGAPAYERRNSAWGLLVCTALQLGPNQLFSWGGGWVRVHDALHVARGFRMHAGMQAQLQLLNVGGVGITVPPIGWFAVSP